MKACRVVLLPIVAVIASVLLCSAACAGTSTTSNQIIGKFTYTVRKLTDVDLSALDDVSKKAFAPKTPEENQVIDFTLVPPEPTSCFRLPSVPLRQDRYS